MIKTHITVFNNWQKRVIGYIRYRVEYDKADISLHAYTKNKKYIKLVSRVPSTEKDLLSEINKIMQLWKTTEDGLVK